MSGLDTIANRKISADGNVGMQSGHAAHSELCYLLICSHLLLNKYIQKNLRVNWSSE